jgi:hypothetical protein
MDADLHIRDLLASPERYHNCRLRVSGVYMYFHENECLDGTPPDDSDIPYDPESDYRVWLTISDKTQLIGFTRKYGHYFNAVVDGVYIHGRSGHCGRYQGKLTDIRAIVAVPA